MSTQLHTKEPWSADNGDGKYYGIFDRNGAELAYLVRPEHCGGGVLEMILPVDENFESERKRARNALLNNAEYSNFKEHKANAERIVACVNVCAGIDTEQLLIITDANETFDFCYNRLKKQRDELLKELKAARRSIRAIKRNTNKYEDARKLCVIADKRVCNAIATAESTI